MWICLELYWFDCLVILLLMFAWFILVALIALDDCFLVVFGFDGFARICLCCCWRCAVCWFYFSCLCYWTFVAFIVWLVCYFVGFVILRVLDYVVRLLFYVCFLIRWRLHLMIVALCLIWFICTCVAFRLLVVLFICL